MLEPAKLRLYIGPPLEAPTPWQLWLTMAGCPCHNCCSRSYTFGPGKRELLELRILAVSKVNTPAHIITWSVHKTRNLGGHTS